MQATNITTITACIRFIRPSGVQRGKPTAQQYIPLWFARKNASVKGIGAKLAAWTAQGFLIRALSPPRRGNCPWALMQSHSEGCLVALWESAIYLFSGWHAAEELPIGICSSWFISHYGPFKVLFHSQGLSLSFSFLHASVSVVIGTCLGSFLSIEIRAAVAQEVERVGW